MRHENTLALCLLIISVVALLFIPWWAALLLFLIGYCVVGAVTLNVAVGKVERCTGLSRERARQLYRAAITGNWSGISDEELQHIPKNPTFRSKLETQLATCMMAESVRRRVGSW
jgi:ABC-type transport system involved in cytochrome bd biosynthesis fused ATPase/permease subunit